MHLQAAGKQPVRNYILFKEKDKLGNPEQLRGCDDSLDTPGKNRQRSRRNVLTKHRLTTPEVYNFKVIQPNNIASTK
jgi:hypothetical protein